MAVQESDGDRVCQLMSELLQNNFESSSIAVSNPSLQAILRYDPMKRTCGYIVILGLAVALLFGGAYICKIAYYDLEPGDKCFIENPTNEVPLFKTILAKKNNCNFCRNVRKITKRRNLSPAEFERKYAYTMRPVVVTDAAKNWTAIDVFSFDFLKEIFQGRSLEAVGERCQFFPYRSNFENLGDVFNMPKDRAERHDGTEPWYVGWSNCHLLAAEALRKHYGRPYFLPKLSEASKVDWIFMGSPGYGAPLHVDDVKLPSWQAQLKGRKRWTLEPPYECRLDCPNNLTVTVNPGEIIVLDTNFWYHGTEIVGSEMSITIGTEYD